jgi:methionyl-tRNA formyltransferase
MVAVASGNGVPGEVLAAHSDGLVVACGEGAIRVAELQPEGGRRLSAGEFLGGHPLAAGDRFFSLERPPQ